MRGGGGFQLGGMGAGQLVDLLGVGGGARVERLLVVGLELFRLGDEGLLFLKEGGFAGLQFLDAAGVGGFQGGDLGGVGGFCLGGLFLECGAGGGGLAGVILAQDLQGLVVGLLCGLEPGFMLLAERHDLRGMLRGRDFERLFVIGLGFNQGGGEGVLLLLGGGVTRLQKIGVVGVIGF